MAKPVHSMIRVLDEARSLDFYAVRSTCGSPIALVFQTSRWFICATRHRRSNSNSP